MKDIRSLAVDNLMAKAKPLDIFQDWDSLPFLVTIFELRKRPDGSLFPWNALLGEEFQSEHVGNFIVPNPDWNFYLSQINQPALMVTAHQRETSIWHDWRGFVHH